MDKKKAPTGGQKKKSGVRTVFGLIGRFFATCVMVGIITGCIVACVMTVYIFNYIGEADSINLDDVKLGYTSTMLYYNNDTGKYEELQKLYMSDNNRIWVNYDQISDYVKEAAIAIEDKRFDEHQGVDWKRTFGAFANMFIPGASKGGGSTITQQLIKNVTDDDDYRIDRKVREIFRALELEKHYSKERILEAYLNVVPFGAGTNGIQTAALTYYGKDAKDLDLAQAASIVGITKAPYAYNPFINQENNKNRQLWVLEQMLEQGKITQAEYDQASTQTLQLKREEYQQQQEGTVMTYFEDHVINTVLADLQEQRGWTSAYAVDQLYKSGYKIYTTVDMEMQQYLEELFLDTEGFPAVHNEMYPQACATIIDPNGKLLAVVGGIGEKTGNRMFNRATMATRHPGSAIKPIGVYAVAFEYDRVRWSTVIEDGPIQLNGRNWPTNYYGEYIGPITVAYAIQQSVNTVPVKLVQAIGERPVFDFMHDQLNMYNLVDSVVVDGAKMSDVSLAPLALGALTKGVTPLEMVGAFQIFDNGGTFTTPYCYTRVEDSNGRIILEADTTARHVISEETSVVMNKALQMVTSQGTGTAARLNAMPTAGKTGTSDADINQWFVGMTPYYVCQVWLGYDNEKVKNSNGYYVDNSIYYGGLGYPPPKLWKTIMEPLHEGLDYIPFPESENVVSRSYCTVTGLLATANCGSVAPGWFKQTATGMPSSCPGHAAAPTKTEDGDGDGDDDAPKSSSSKSSSSKSTSSKASSSRASSEAEVLRVQGDD